MMCFSRSAPLMSLTESPLFISPCYCSECVYVCVWSCESAVGGGEGGAVGFFVHSQQGEDLEQLVLHLAQLCHWL